MKHFVFGIFLITFGLFVIVADEWVYRFGTLQGFARYLVAGVFIGFGAWIIYLIVSEKK
jgi:threonine/homoserine/homoserine lactone efflux protein